MKFVQAQSLDNIASFNISTSTAQKGYNFFAWNKNFRLILLPKALNGANRIEITKIDEQLPFPWLLDLVSPVYQLELSDKSIFSASTSFPLEIKYQANNYYKKVYYYNRINNFWQPLPTKDHPKEKYVSVILPFSFARLAVFADPDVLTSGRASWYKYKGGNFAASPDFPAGSKLRVFNLDNNKFIDVVINDYGPERTKYPDRVLDIDKVAFKKLAPLLVGTIRIAVVPLEIKPDANGYELGLPDKLKSILDLKAKSAVIFNEENNNIIWSKNATATLPIASLSKLISVSAFLDTKPSLNTVITYLDQDEKYNYQYCLPSESAKLKIKFGETFTIEDALYSSLVGSANNTIETLVRNSGLTRDNFIALMNLKVREWGASTTHFVEPTGLSPQNMSSALDYAIIAKEVLKNPILSKSSTMSEYRFKTINTKVAHRIKNTDQLIHNSKYIITGSKTGYLDEAGYCLMVRVKAGKTNLIVVILGDPDRNTSFNETEQLILYGLRNK